MHTPENDRSRPAANGPAPKVSDGDDLTIPEAPVTSVHATRHATTVTVACPHCGRGHTHGIPEADLPTVRAAHCGDGAQAYRITAEHAAYLALRCAWLRHHARELDGSALDPTGLLAAQLRDFADLLEVAEERGWFA